MKLTTAHIKDLRCIEIRAELGTVGLNALQISLKRWLRLKEMKDHGLVKLRVKGKVGYWVLTQDGLSALDDLQAANSRTR